MGVLDRPGRSGLLYGMQPRVHKLFASIWAVAALTTPLQALADCGLRGGPGYRGPNGQCVGWANLGRVCGDPPTTNCTPEIAHPNAPEAAKHGTAIETLRPNGGAASLLAQPATAAGGPLPQNVLSQCTGIADSKSRLECFDRVAGTKK
jgi:hypothetical protein